jgi:hypothetical protein
MIDADWDAIGILYIIEKDIAIFFLYVIMGNYE